jgi:hypothetical protein
MAAPTIKPHMSDSTPDLGGVSGDDSGHTAEHADARLLRKVERLSTLHILLAQLNRRLPIAPMARPGKGANTTDSLLLTPKEPPPHAEAQQDVRVARLARDSGHPLRTRIRIPRSTVERRIAERTKVSK